MNLQNIRLIARYERKKICRNPAFLGIAASGLIAIFIMQYLLQGKEHAAIWYMVTLPSAIPFINAYLFTILQSFLIVLAVSEWRASEKNADALESLRVHAYGNNGYITGKTLGIGSVILALNALSITLAAGMNLLSSDAPFNGWLYLFYAFTLTLPAMLFLTGFSLLVTSLVRNRALATILLTGYIISTTCYLTGIHHGIFDYIASTIPNVFSEVIGHVAPLPYLAQRTAFFLLGTGCIGFAAVRERRLPNRANDVTLSKIHAITCTCVAFAAGIFFHYYYQSDTIARTPYRESGIKHANAPLVHVPEHAITYKQEGNTIHATSKLQLVNNEKQPARHVILFLNPALKITSLTNDQGIEIPRRRENQVIIIDRELSPGDTTFIRVDYAGTIDDRVCYLDADDKTYRNYQLSNCPMHFGKRFAYTEETFTLLTPESMWYPAATSPVNLVEPFNSRKDFTRFTLSVIAPENKTVISQGSPRQHGDTTRFSNHHPLTGITLCMGLYNKRSVRVDSVNMELYTFKNNNTISTIFDNVPEDILNKNLSETKTYLEQHHNQSYPFTKFVLAETPVSFNTNRRRWENHGDLVQPEIVLFPEKWINNTKFYPPRFSKGILKHQANMKRLGFIPDKTWEEQLIQYFTRYTFLPSSNKFSPRNIFMPGLPGKKRLKREIPNEQCLEPLFYNYTNYLYSANYPVINKILYLLESTYESQPRFFRGDNLMYKASQYLSSRSLKEAITDTTLPQDIYSYILQLKTIELANSLNFKQTTVNIRQFLKKYKQMHPFQEIDFDDLCREIKTCFNTDLRTLLPAWYNAKNIPAYTIMNAQVCSIVPGENEAYQVSFDIQNHGKADGFISVCIAAQIDNKYWQIYHIPAGTSWKIKEIVYEKPIFIQWNQNLSSNLPSGLTEIINDITCATTDTSQGQFAINPRQFLPDPSEIIVDNEDEGFRLHASGKKIFGSLQKKDPEKQYIFDLATIYSHGVKYSELWTPYAHPTKYYGKTIKSCYYKPAGKGNTPATWKASLPKPGRYEIFIYVNTGQPIFTGIPEQYYTLTTREGLENITLKLDQDDSGWASIGIYNLDTGENSITLSDKGVDPDQLVFADAVKWKFLGK